MNNKRHSARTERQQQRNDSGSVAQHFPDVSGIVIRMMYHQKGIKGLLRTFNFSPGSYAFFRVDCLCKDCTDGGFDLTQVINGMVRNRREAAKGELSCEGSAQASDHASIAYEVAILYS
ncbi:MAG: hypothetical protein M0Z79_10765 [Nitrospiraceae bacterium]|nr:hypothetical protein [Nitrospiraceae bacterium]